MRKDTDASFLAPKIHRQFSTCGDFFQGSKLYNSWKFVLYMIQPRIYPNAKQVSK